MARVVLLGPPGSGKGTQAEAIARRLGVPHLSTGAILRAAAAAGTPLGREAERYMGAGRLVPDELVLGLIEERLSDPDGRAGYLFDGFPRTVAQAEALEHIAPVDRVLSFEIPFEELLQRLTGRRTCPACGSVYNTVTLPPKRAGRCDRDGAELTKRSDDEEGAARTRLEVYRKETAPLLEFYRARKRLAPIDATGAPGLVAARIDEALEALAPSSAKAYRSTPAP